MPLKQSLLNFAGSAGLLSSRSTRPRPTPSRTASSLSTNDSDTITVAVPKTRIQLPTPSESATDVSSQGTDIISMNDVSKGRGKSVSRGGTKNQSEDCVLDSTEDTFGTVRAVSGETLVNHPGMSQSSLMKEGVAALNLPWSMSEVFETGSKAELLSRKRSAPYGSTDTLDTLTPDEETEQARREKAAAKVAKMEENKKARDAKWEAEDAKATRRSSRASMLTKAGDIVSDLASSVLGKRKDRVSELRGSFRPRSALGAVPVAESPAPNAKRRRLSDSDIPTSTNTVAVNPSKTVRPAKDKKWLISGLYTGQSRPINPGTSESKNKRKSVSESDDKPQKENSVLPLPMFAGERLLKQGRDFKLPFDIFSPLPAGQPKPDEWRKSNKNTFVGDASQEWRISKFIEHSTCMCSPSVGCDQNCMNGYMYYECDERNCNLTAEQCGNRAFEGLKGRTKKGGKYNIGVEVIKTADRGNGVRANRTFEPNQIIVEYTGEIVTQEECERRMREVYKENESYYLMLFDQNMIIDATSRGSIARFVNHSCDPNCRMEKWTVSGQPRMALFAGDRGIMTGRELTYDYNFDPYCAKNVQECKCGEKGCRGILGPKSKEDKERKETSNGNGNGVGAGEGKLKGVKRKIVEIVEESLANKKQKLGVKEVKTSVRSPARKVHKSPKKRVVSGNVRIAKAKKTIRRSSAPIASAGLGRKPSKLKTLLNRATSVKDRGVGKGNSKRNSRVISGASDELLLAKDRQVSNGSVKRKMNNAADVAALPPVKRTTSLKGKIAKIRSRA